MLTNMSDDKNYSIINPSRCKGCSACVDACPKGCLEIGTEINKLGYQYAIFSKENCIACSFCFYSCPEFGAITIYKKSKKVVNK